MAFTAKDGSRHTNHSSMRQADARFAAKQPAQPEQPMDDESEQPEDVAEQHGPAIEVNVMHEHESGQHRVHSKHPDGHEHHSEHGSAEEAHDHAKRLASSDKPDAGYVEEGY